MSHHVNLHVFSWELFREPVWVDYVTVDDELDQQWGGQGKTSENFSSQIVTLSL